MSAVRDEAKKESDQAEKTANDALNSLQDLAKLQVKLFTEEVKWALHGYQQILSL